MVKIRRSYLVGLLIAVVLLSVWYVSALSPPVVDSLSISTVSGLNRTSENVTAYAAVSDADADNISVAYDWRRSGLSWSTINLNFDVQDSAGVGKTLSYSSYAANGTIIGATYSANGGRNRTGAYLFDGSLDAIRVSNASYVQPGSGDWSISMWFKSSVTSGPDMYLAANDDWYGSADPVGFLLEVCVSGCTTNKGRIIFRADEVGTDLGYAITTRNYTDGRWHHLAVVYDSGVSARIYLDGVNDTNISNAFTDVTSIATIQDLYIGAIPNASDGSGISQSFNGAIDDVRIFKETLSSEQINALALNRTNVFGYNGTVVGDNLSVCVTPNDGTSDGNRVCTGEMRIRPGCPDVSGRWTVSSSASVNAAVDCDLINVTRGATLTINNNVSVRGSRFWVWNGTITAPVGGIINLSGTNFTLKANGRVYALGKGYAGVYSADGNGPCGGSGVDGTDEGSGGCYGGVGGSGSPTGSRPAVYGSVIAPTSFGSAGGAYNRPGFGIGTGANGGGAIKIAVDGTIDVTGNITANGADGVYSSFWGLSAGAGSGGSVWLVSNQLIGSGRITARGGNGEQLARGGGGGRISAWYSSSSFSGFISARGGDSGTSNDGGPGTVFLNASGVGTVRISNEVISSSMQTNTSRLSFPLSVEFLNLSNVTIRGDSPNASRRITIRGTVFLDSPAISSGRFDVLSGAVLTHTDDSTQDSYRLNVTTVNLTVWQGGKISVDGRGYSGVNGEAGNGPCPGMGGSGTYDGSGGCHGGIGGSGTIAGSYAVYDSVTAPVMPGSAGGGWNRNSAGTGGDGGGAIIVRATGVVNVTGNVTADGSSGAYSTFYGYSSGGGSGGSIWIRSGQLVGTGSITSRGGASVSIGRGGGGGRIAIGYASRSFTGLISARGGDSPSSSDGGPGSIFLNHSGIGTLVVDNEVLSSSEKFNTSSTVMPTLVQHINFTNATILGDALNVSTISSFMGTVFLGVPLVSSSVQVRPGASLTHPDDGSADTYRVNITASSLTIWPLGRITADGRGYVNVHGATGNGPCGGSYSTDGGGGCYGGLGGAGTVAGGSKTYGDLTYPTRPGSSGGSGNGITSTSDAGDGGGVVVLSIGTINVSGNITARGGNGNSGGASGGGGSGGSILISSTNLTGSGYVMARGGTGGSNGGGGGGGGRIALFYSSDTSTIRYVLTGGAGGGGGAAGTAGTLFRCVESANVSCPGSLGSISLSTVRYSRNYTMNVTRRLWKDWNSTRMDWNETPTVGTIASYTIAGLTGSEIYKVHEDGVFNDSFYTTAAGATPRSFSANETGGVRMLIIQNNTGPSHTMTFEGAKGGNVTIPTNENLICSAASVDTDDLNTTFYYKIFNGSTLYDSGTRNFLANVGSQIIYNLSYTQTNAGEKWNCSIVASDFDMNDTWQTLQLNISPLWLNLTLALEVGSVGEHTSFVISGQLNYSNWTTISGVAIPLVLNASWPDWWNASWVYRKQVTIQENAHENLTGYSIPLRVDTESLIAASKMREDCGDMRFADEDGDALPYWIANESRCGMANTTVYVKMDIPSLGSKSVFMYYGNTGAASASNGSEALLFFDDFSSDTISNYSWSSAAWSISGGSMTHVASGSNEFLKLDGADFDDVVVETRAINNDNAGVGVTARDGAAFTTYYACFGYPAGSLVGLQESNAWLSSVSQGVSAAQWKYYTLRIYDQGLRCTYEHGLNVSYFDVTLANGSIGFRSNTNNPAAKFDYLLARKFVSPEPSSAWGSEQARVVTGSTGLFNTTAVAPLQGSYSVTASVTYDNLVTSVTKTFAATDWPLAANVSILPARAFTNDSLKGYCNGTYGAQPTLDYAFKWYRNGVENISGTNTNGGSGFTQGTTVLVSTVLPGNTTRDERWVLSCRPQYGGTLGGWKNSSEIVIQNWIPSISATPSSEYGGNTSTQDLLPAMVREDIDGDPIDASFDWRENKTSIAKILYTFNSFENGGLGVTRDFSTNGLYGIPTNGATWNATAGWNGTGAYQFDGKDDYLQTTFNLDEGGSKSYTLMAWVKPKYKSNEGRAVFSTDNGGYDWSVYATAGSRWYAYTGENARDLGFAVDEDQWQHVAIVFDETQGRIRFYKNGDESALHYLATDSSDNNLVVGRIPYSTGSAYFNGTIDDVRVYERALSAAQIRAIYQNQSYWLDSAETAASTNYSICITPGDLDEEGATQCHDLQTKVGSVPSQSGAYVASATLRNTTPEDLIASLVRSDADSDRLITNYDWRRNGTSIALINYPFDIKPSGTIYDISSHKRNATNTGATWEEGVGVNGSGALYFSGADNLLVSGLSSTSQNYTFSFWFKSSMYDTTFQYLFDSQTGRLIVAYMGSTSGKIGFYDGTWRNLADAPQDEQWHHAIFTFNKAAGLGSYYLDGSFVTSAAYAGANIGGTTRIGSSYDGTASKYQGYLDDFRLYDRVLSTTQIAQLFANDSHVLTSAETRVADNWTICMSTNDGYLQSSQSCASVLVRDSSVTTNAISLTPTTAYSTDKLIGYCNGTTDLSTSAYYWRWYKDGVLNSSGFSNNGGANYTVGALVNIANLSASNTSHLQTWVFSCTVTDGLLNGSWLNVSRHINNSLPVVGLVVNSSNGLNNTYANITAYVSSSDADADTVYRTVDWRKGGTSIAVLNLNFDLNNSAGTAKTRDFTTYSNNGTLGSTTARPFWNATGGPDGSGAFKFDGGDIISFGDDTEYEKAKNITVSAWFRLDADTSEGASCIINKDGGYNNGYRICENKASHLVLWQTGDAGATTLSSTSAITYGRWYHVVGAYDGAHNFLYLNGVLNNSNTKTSNIPFSTRALEIGRGDPTSSNVFYWTGAIDDVKIFDRNLTRDEIVSLYNQGLTKISSKRTRFNDNWTACVTADDSIEYGAKTCSSLRVISTPPTIDSFVVNSSAGTNRTQENLTAYVSTSDVDGDTVRKVYDWRVNGTSIAVLNLNFEPDGGQNATDRSTWGHDGTVEGAAPYVSSGLNGSRAYDFQGSGSGDGVNLGAWNASENFSVEAWFYADSYQNGDNGLVTKWDNVNNKRSWGMYISSSSARPEFCISSTGANYDCEWASGTSVSTGTWHHMVATYNGSGAAGIGIFFDGTRLSHSAASVSGTPSGQVYQTNTIVYVGRSVAVSGGAYYFDGRIDNVRVYNRTLTAAQARALYLNRTNVIVSDETQIGDNWTACVTPNDGLVDGSTVCTTGLIVLPSDTCTPPSINNDWTVRASDYCVKSAQTIDLGTGQLIVTGSFGPGSITFRNSNLLASNIVVKGAGNLTRIILENSQLVRPIG